MSRCPNEMRMARLTTPNSAKQNGQQRTIRVPQFGSETRSSESAPVTISKSPTLRLNECGHQVCNDPVRVIMD